MEPWQHRFENKMAEAELFFNEQDYGLAFNLFREAVSLVPAPASDHYEATRAVTGVADCYYFLGKYELAEQPLRDLLLLPGGAANPYIRLRRGQVYCHLESLKQARLEWTTAYMNAGKEIFEGETDCKPEIDQLIAELEASLGSAPE